MQKQLAEIAGDKPRICIISSLTRLDALESGQFKYALQVCNKTLKKAKGPAEITQLNVRPLKIQAPANRMGRLIKL